MRPLIALALLPLLSGCNSLAVAGSDVAMGAGAGYLLFGDDIDEIQTKGVEEIQAEDVAKGVRDAVPPRAKSTAHKVADKVRDNVRATSRHVKKWWFYDPEKEVKVARDTPNSYCYRTGTDVLCYRQPMPGWERRLVGYQGTYATAPSPVAMQLLPTNGNDTGQSPESRVANAKPVFTEMPAEVKEEPKAVIDPQDPAAAAAENVHEPIADPTLSPQL